VRVLVGAAVVALLAGCGVATAGPERSRPVTEAYAAPAVVECVLGDGGRADRRCDPGVRNPAVTQETIGTTLCRPGWAEKVRPPTSYTTPLKREDMKRYGLTGSVEDYRYDHLLALSLGGSPANTDNLWPQPVEESYVKDQHTRRLKTRVCAGEMTLAEAQAEILEAWTWQP
jgi:hypothetical protein